MNILDTIYYFFIEDTFLAILSLFFLCGFAYQLYDSIKAFFVDGPMALFEYDTRINGIPMFRGFSLFFLIALIIVYVYNFILFPS